MDTNDALMITFLGISVVFIGLLLTSLMIYSFSLIPKIAGIFKKEDVPETPPVVEAEPSITVEPEVIAVITAVLEVEFRKLSLLEGKFTFK